MVTASESDSVPAWAWDAAADQSYGQVCAALTVAGPLPDRREATPEQTRALVATGLARLGMNGVRELDARLRHLGLLWTDPGTDPAVSKAAGRSWLRLYGGTRRVADNTVALASRYRFPGPN